MPRSAAPPPLRGRPPVRQTAVRDALRQALIAGRWRAGERLPPRLRLVEELKTTSSTLQSALDELIAEGQIVARGALGTFVAAVPPFQNRFGLVLPSAAEEHGDWNRLWQALALVAGQPRADGRVIEVFYTPHRRFASASFDRLLDECARQLIAGLILVVPPTMVAGTALASVPIPRVYLSNAPVPPGDALMSFDYPSFRRLAIASLRRRGCRRIAVLAGAGLLASSAEGQAWESELAAAGMATRRAWILGCDLEHPAPASRVVQLLFSRPEDRPDGLVVADDHLLAPAGVGLAAEGLASGREVHLVAHANFPLPDASGVACERIGFDAGQAITAALEFCAARRRGDPAAENLVITARLEADLSRP